MSADIKWKGRKWTGSPNALKKQVAKEAKKKGSFAIPDPSSLENNILFGWYFECGCGATGKNYYDTKRSIQCDVCKVWMHCQCNGVPTKPAELMQYFKRYVWICPSCKSGDYKYRSIHWKKDSNTNLIKRRKTITFMDQIDGSSSEIEDENSSDNKETKNEPTDPLKSSMKQENSRKTSFKKVLSVPDLSKMPSGTILKASKPYEDNVLLPNPDTMAQIQGRNSRQLKRTRSLKRVASVIRDVYMENIYNGDVD